MSAAAHFRICKDKEDAGTCLHTLCIAWQHEEPVHDQLRKFARRDRRRRQDVSTAHRSEHSHGMLTIERTGSLVTCGVGRSHTIPGSQGGTRRAGARQDMPAGNAFLWLPRRAARGQRFGKISPRCYCTCACTHSCHLHYVDVPGCLFAGAASGAKFHSFSNPCSGSAQGRHNGRLGAHCQLC